MRLVGLVLLAGCSMLIPPRLWHPSGWEAEEGQLGCPSYAYPVVDLAFGVPMLALGAAGAVVATQPPPATQSVGTALGDGIVKSLAAVVAAVGLTAGVAWTGSSIYGFSNEHSCHRELRGDGDVRR